MQLSNCLINIKLEPGPGTSEETLAQQTSVLLGDICQLEGVQAELERTENSEKGSRGDAIAIGTILISMISGGVITALIQFLRDWALRGENRKVTIKAKVNKNSIEFVYHPSGTKESDLINFAEKLTQLLENDNKRHASKN